MASSIFLLIKLGMMVAPSAALYIFGKEYLMIEDKRLWTDEAPSFLEFTGPILSIKALIGTQGYDLGPHFENNPVRADSKVLVPNYKPILKNTFTDTFGNVLECNDGSALFMFKATNKRYLVKTVNSPFILQCHGDYKRNRVLIIAGSRRVSTMGKLYALDTKEAEVIRGEVIVPEIPLVGDLISAVTVRPSNGIILLSKEVTERVTTYYQMVYLQPVHFKFLTSNKFTKLQVAHANEFENTLTKAGDKLYQLFVEFWNKRTSRLISENTRLRILAETQLQTLRHPDSRMPGLGVLLDPVLKAKDFKELIKDYSDNLMRLYKKYLLEPKVVEEYRCRKILTRLRTRVAHYLGKFNIEEGTRVVDVSSLGLARRVNSTTGAHVSVLGLPYEMSIANTYINEPPEYIFPKDNSGVLRVLIGQEIFKLGRDFGAIDHEKSYTGSPAIPDTFGDRHGNTLYCSDGQVFFKDQKRCPIEKCAVITGQSFFNELCILDYERNRAFIISSEKVNAAKGSLFVFDTEKLTVDGAFINATQVKEVGENITAVSVDSATGDIYLTEEVMSPGGRAFNLVVLKPTAARQASRRRSIQRRQIRPSTHYIDGNEFITTLNNNATHLTNFHNEHWLERMQELIHEQNELKKTLHGPVRDPQKNISSFLLSEIAKCLKESWYFKLLAAIVEIQKDVIAVYDRHLLSNETRRILEADKKCLTTLSDVQRKGRDLLSEIVAPVTDRAQPPGSTTTECPKTWPLSC